MLSKIDHIGIAVRDLNEVLNTFNEAFGLEPAFLEEVSDQKVKIAGYQLAESKVEYLEPTSADSPISRFLNKRGNAIHHIAFAVENLDEAIKTLVDKGFGLIDQLPRKGANDMRIVFLHPASFNGILIELCQSQP